MSRQAGESGAGKTEKAQAESAVLGLLSAGSTPDRAAGAGGQSYLEGKRG